MLDKFKFLLFFILVFVLIAIIYFIHYEKDMKSFYQKKELNLDFSDKKAVSSQKMVFMENIIRAAQYSNYNIIQERSELEKYQKAYSNAGDLSKFQKINLIDLANNYGIETDFESLTENKFQDIFDELKLKIQIVPVRLTLAQAIIESAWGTSRFAKEGNAYFGIHCYEEGCGMPFGSGKSKVFVKTYPDLTTSVVDYMLFLNAKPGPKNFRLAREVYFESAKSDIFQLANGLDSYSEIGGDYQKIIRDLIQNYIPEEIKNY